MAIFVDFGPAFLHLRQLQIFLTSESPQISTRWSQTSDEGIVTLSCKCCTQELLDDYQFSGNKEGSQTDVTGYEVHSFTKTPNMVQSELC